MSKSTFIISLLCAVLLGGCGARPTIGRIRPDTRILAFGDSLTFGVGAERNESYPYLLEQKLGCAVVNAGVSGEDTTQGVKRLGVELRNNQPDLVILCFGGNDFLNDQSQNVTRSNLREMIRMIKDGGADVVLIGVPEPALLLRVPAFFEELSTEFNIPYEGKVLRAVLSKGTLKSDYIHPNKRGYQVMAEQIYALIERSAR